MKQADVRFYVDADVLGLGKVLSGLRADVTFPGDPGASIHKRVRPACPIADPATLDSIWIPAVSARRWLVITRDSAIRKHPAEIEAVRSHGARLVALAGAEATNTWAQLEIVMTQWRRLERLLEETGPFIFTATRTSLTQLDLARD